VHDARGKRGHHEQKFAGLSWNAGEPIRALTFLRRATLRKTGIYFPLRSKGRPFQIKGQSFPNHALVVPENGQQDDDWQRHTEQPQ
jgi:hypothetical protein